MLGFSGGGGFGGNIDNEDPMWEPFPTELLAPEMMERGQNRHEDGVEGAQLLKGPMVRQKFGVPIMS